MKVYEKSVKSARILRSEEFKNLRLSAGISSLSASQYQSLPESVTSFVPNGIDKFTKPLHAVLDHYPENYLAQILSPFYYYLEDDYSRAIIVPVGFATDFTSVPAFARAIYPIIDRTAKAAVIHDYLYGGGWIRDSKGNFLRQPTRKQADLIYYQGLKILGASNFEATVKYYAVRLGGRGWWNNPRKDLYSKEPYGITPQLSIVS